MLHFRLDCSLLFADWRSVCRQRCKHRSCNQPCPKALVLNSNHFVLLNCFHGGIRQASPPGLKNLQAASADPIMWGMKSFLTLITMVLVVCLGCSNQQPSGADPLTGTWTG